MLQRRPLPALLLLLGTLAVGPAAASPPRWQDWVLKLDVLRTDGRKEVGSAVLIGREQLLTNCHVVRNARRIEASQGDAIWLASVDIGDSFRDLCLLKLPGHPGAPATIADPDHIRVGQRVRAVGYSGGRFSVSPGRIKGLFSCACGGVADGRVIQTSAAFDPGASGGGLFDADDELVGILTFKSHEGGSFHFAVPVGWMQQLSAPAVDGLGPFWASPSAGNGYFLAACDLSAHKKWRELSQLTAEWVSEEPYNPEAWMAAGRAKLGLKRLREAAAAFQKALALDSAHAEAVWELERLEVELDESLIGN